MVRATVVVKFCLSFVFISTKQSSGTLSVSVSKSSHSVLSNGLESSNNQSGPLNQQLCSLNSSIVIPRDGMSAGFSSPGQCFQYVSGTSRLISLTRFCTYCFHSLSPFIQQRANLESVQQVLSLIVKSDARACSTTTISLARISADSSSNLGIVLPLPGATLAFDVTNCTCIPAVVFNRRYITAPHALDDASQKPCSSQDITV